MNPHDALFRSTFASIDVARGHLPRLLPSDLARAIDWSSLRVEPGSFIDEALAETHSDLLYGATMQGEDALVYALFEHQSSFDKWMPLRLLHYVASVWKRWLAETPRAAFAPPVVAIVLHHSEAGWRAAPTLALAAPPDVDRAAVRSILLRVAGPAHREDVMNAGEQMIHEGRLEGEIRKSRELLRRVLFVRGIGLSELGAARVDACADCAQVDEWVLRAATATTEADVFAVTR